MQDINIEVEIMKENMKEEGNFNYIYKNYFAV
jgi:hypothetical protein